MMALEAHTAPAGSSSNDNNGDSDPWSDKTWGRDAMGMALDDAGNEAPPLDGNAHNASPEAAGEFPNDTAALSQQQQQQQQQPSPLQDDGEALFPFSADPTTTNLESQFEESASAVLSQTSSGFFVSDDQNMFRTATTAASTVGEGSSVPNETATATTEPAAGGATSSFAATGHASDDQNNNNNTVSGLVRVAVHEQVSALYDGVTDEPACHVEGSIYVQPSSDLQAKPFLLVIRDLDGHVANFKDWPSTCQNVSDRVSRKGLHRTDRVLRITTKGDQHHHAHHTTRPIAAVPEDALVAQYICTDRVRPVPMLIKSRVVTNHKYCRVGFKIRANPSNTLPLTRVVLLLAVPPHIEGRTAKMSRRGGVWDELKRTISWVVPKLDPGEALEIQAQFEGPGTDGTQENSNTSPRFPILARGDYAESYSSVEVKKSDVRDGMSHPIHSLKLNRSGRVLHRKV